VISLPATTLYAQEEELVQETSMIGTKYTEAEDLGMFHFFSAAVGKSFLLEAFSSSETLFDARHIRVFLVESEGDREERTIVDELMFDRTTHDSFSYIPVYDRRSNSTREYFARYVEERDTLILKEIYECDIEQRKILSRQPIPGMRIVLDEP
jgi:hypothetical protein